MKGVVSLCDEKVHAEEAMRWYWIIVSSVIVLGSGYLVWRYVTFGDWRPLERVTQQKQPLGASPLPSTKTPIITKAGAVLCKFEMSFGEAEKAIQADDEQWLNSIGCMQAQGGVPVVPIDTTDLWGKPRAVWRVRVRPSSGEGMTMYGHSWDFEIATPP
jgi:hypothetical protein